MNNVGTKPKAEVMASADADAVEPVLKELSKALSDAKNEGRLGSIFENMESIISSATSDGKKIKRLNRVLARGDEETRKLWEQIKEGKKLVHEYLKINCCCWWCCCKKCCYKKKLTALQDSLKKFCHDMAKDTEGEVTNNQKVNDNQDNVKDSDGEVADTQKANGNQHNMKDTDEKVEDTQKEKGNQQIQHSEQDTGVNVEGRSDNEKMREAEPSNIMRDKNKLELSNLMETGTMLNSGAPPCPCMPPEPPEYIVGLDGPLRDLKKKLLNDEESVVILSAPTGYGKTILAKKICQDKQVKDKFVDNILFVTVSKTPNLKAIVQLLFHHQGYQMPEIQSDEDAGNRLDQLLKQMGQKPILLVLDDVWPGSDTLLDKFKLQKSDYKILVTSTSTFPGFGCTFTLDTLNYKDSMSLFCHSAGLKKGKSYIVDQDVVEKVVKACKGLPLTLIKLGKSLRGRPTEIWKSKEMELSQDGGIFKDNNLFNCLQSSLDALDNKARIKECYMDLGSFPEGQLIPASALTDMWAELYELDENGLNCIANLHELSSLNLVNLVVTRKDTNRIEGCYDDHFVMLHDLLTELVNHVSGLGPINQRKRLVVDVGGQEIPKWWKEQKQQPLSARLLSISTDEKFTSKWLHMHAPEVEVVVLNFRTNNYALPEFLGNMDKLKALIVTNSGFCPAEISNFPFLGNLSTLKRITLEHVSIPSLNHVQLKNLRKLSLYACNIDKAIGNTNIQIPDALPHLIEINIDYCNFLVELLVGLSDIFHLQKLSITYCPGLSILPKEVGKLVNLEVLKLSSCINLLGLPDTIRGLCKLSILDMSDCMRIRILPEQISELQNLTKLYMAGCSNCGLPKSIVKLVQLKYVICDEDTAKLWKPLKRHFSNLKILM